MAAKLSSADPDSSADLRLISYTDLAKFDPGTEYRCQILYQFTEINSSVCGKVKQHFIVVKGIFCIDQLHLQSMLVDLFQTNLKCFFFFFAILFFYTAVILCRQADHCLKRLGDLFILHFLRSHHNVTEFYSSRGLYNYLIATLHLKFAR